MGDLFFFMRVMFITMVVVVLMQIRWGNTTIENHAMDFMTSSSLVRPVEDVASGAVRFTRNMWSKFTRTINTNFSNALRSENHPGERQALLSLKRSQEYLREKQNEPEIREARETATNYIEKFKREAAKTTKKIRGQFIDETVVPGKDNRASATGDDDELVEE